MRTNAELNYDQAHEFVNANKGNGFFWDGYTIVKWSPGHNGYLQTNGLYRNNKWGYASRFSMTEQGVWILPGKYVKST